ncbi:zinc finger MYM-type protein 1-like [Neodiprion pinetum]|uniref:zinc finger MYM-type protein 1-like n=1 Tax=Neodiprion pinetum TaxID=441929 RepID=UPI00371F2E2A
MSDRHKTPRVFASGSQKRKLQAERVKKSEESLAKTPKLTSFFTSLNKEEIPQDPKKNNRRFNKAELSEELSGLKNDIGLWPVNITKEMIDYWAKKGSTELQNCDQVSLQNSVPQDQPRDTSNFVRKCTKNMFTRRNKNQETVNRFWLCFSPTTGKIYCYACKLMSTQNTKLSGEGFSDWKHASDRLCEHEISKTHLESVMGLLQRGRVTGRIDQELAMQEAQQIEYWRKNLKIIVSTIKFIAERGLAFRGDNEIVGSPRNGNLLGILELLAEYEPILATHLKTHANKGSGHANYLSSTICEELISCMGDKVLTEIVSTMKKSKYYLVSVDSTPHESHIDQLTIVVRYMEGSTPKERFLTFLPNCGHSGKATANALLTFLGDHQIDIMDCRGQSYDNAANMSGKYKRDAGSYFGEKPFIGVSSSERYGILIEKLSKKKSGQFYVLRKLSDTRWSCRAEATKAIVDGYSEIEEALASISSDKEQKDIARNEAAHLLQKMSSLETALFAIFWNDILERFNATNKMLQDPQMILESAMRALESLKSFVESKRNDFDKYEEAAKKISQTDEYVQSRTRTRTRNVRLNPLNYGKAQDANLSPKEKYKVSAFIPVVDQLCVSLTERLHAYETVRSRFGFLNHIDKMDAENLHAAAEALVKVYQDDLEPSLGNELVQFVSLIDSYKKDYGKDQSPELFYYQILEDQNFRATFPNFKIALRMYLVLMRNHQRFFGKKSSEDFVL